MRMRRPVIIVVGASGASECVKATRLTGSRPLNFAPKHCGADFRSVLGPRLRVTRTARDIPLSLPLSRQAVLGSRSLAVVYEPLSNNIYYKFLIYGKSSIVFFIHW